jgi:hypothetical protein
MGILTDAVYSSISSCGRGYFYFANLSDFEVGLLKSITKRQRHKFSKSGIIPEQVLTMAYDYGWLPGNISPKGGMKLNRLLQWLEAGPYHDELNKESALWFRNKIVDELKPRTPFVNRKARSFKN